MARKNLYRYRRFGTPEEIEWVRQIVQDHVLYCASPASFNDPFDCRIPIKLGTRKRELTKKICEALKRAHPNLARTELREQARILAKDREGNRKIINESMIDTLDRMGVCCFSANRENILSWSHYADKHAGVCMQFTVTSHGGPTIPLKGTLGVTEVNYTRKMPEPIFDHSKATKRQFVDDTILTKYEEWKYEEEWRLIMEENGHYLLSPKLLTGIYVGCVMPVAKIDTILSWAEIRDPSIEVFQAKKREDDFRLDFERIFP